AFFLTVGRARSCVADVAPILILATLTLPALKVTIDNPDDAWSLVESDRGVDDLARGDVEVALTVVSESCDAAQREAMQNVATMQPATAPGALPGSWGSVIGSTDGRDFDLCTDLAPGLAIVADLSLTSDAGFDATAYATATPLLDATELAARHLRGQHS